MVYVFSLEELGVKQDKYVLYCDRQSDIDLNKNATYYARIKHIDVYYHWIRDVLENHLVKIEKIHTYHNPLNIMSMVLTKYKQELCRDLIGMDAT